MASLSFFVNLFNEDALRFEANEKGGHMIVITMNLLTRGYRQLL